MLAFWRKSIARLLIIAILASLPIRAQASTDAYCDPSSPAYCVELVGMVANVAGASSRYAVQNLSSNTASALHQFVVSGTIHTSFNDVLLPGVSRVYTVTSPLGSTTGDVVVKADRPITITALSPIRWLYVPALAMPIPTPQPTVTPRPDCDASYPDVCIPSPPPFLNCGQISYRNFRVLPPDPHRFDADHDGVGCEA